jgi:hypothetical protein
MIRCTGVLLFILLSYTLAAQSSPSASATKAAPDYSGMYSFLEDGEFVQVTVEDQGRVSGFISRYGDLDSDRGAFLDQFFKQGQLEGKKLNFTTNTVHGVWYEFKGTVERGQGKNPGDEAYYVLKGMLTEYNTGTDKKTSSRSREVAFKSFPQDMGVPERKRD